MNWYPLSAQIFRKKRIPVLLLTLVLSAGSLPAEAQSPASTQLAQLSNEVQLNEIQKKAEEFVDLLGAQEFAKARQYIHPDLKAELSLEDMEQIWQELLAVTGPFKRLIDSRITRAVGTDLISVNIQFENTTDRLMVIFDSEQQIVGVDLPHRENSIEAIAEKLVDSLVAQDFINARANLHPFLKAELFPEQIQQQWQELLAVTGPFKKRVSSEVRTTSKVDGIDVVLVTLEFERITDELIVMFNDAKQIIGVNFVEFFDED
ncbi:MAG: DUF3887 domain-containing protein [Xenococcaceae cyanobacterium]